MELNDIYSVTRDEYTGFLYQIKPECRLTQIEEQDDCQIIKTLSSKSGRHFCSRIIYKNGEEAYYAFEMPDAEERNDKYVAIEQYVLETKEEVQSFLDIMAKFKKQGVSND